MAISFKSLNAQCDLARWAFRVVHVSADATLDAEKREKSSEKWGSSINTQPINFVHVII